MSVKTVEGEGAGSLDPTFGTGGTVLHDFQNSGTNAIALQADGKIVFAGSSGNEFGLFRLNANGTLDTSFGINGMVRTQIFTVNNRGSSASDVIIQPDGKIIAVGQAQRGMNPMPPNSGFNFLEVAVVRYNQDGSLDTSFGGGDGIVTTLANGETNVGTAVELQADGKIVVAEFINFAVIRYNADGSLDTNFGASGIARTNFGSNYSRAQDLKIQTDGKIVIAGYDNPVGQVFVAVARYNTNGTLDTGFDGDGKFTASIGLEDRAYGLVIQPDGKMIVVCTTQTAFGAPQYLGLARFLPNGASDTTFGSGGKVIAPASFGSATDIALQADGKIITAGLTNFVFSTSTSDFTVARFLPNGSPDTSFDGDGLAIINLFTGDRANAVAILPDGKIFAAGTSGGYLLAARFQSKSDTFADFDGDGKTDISVFRPSNRVWYIQNSSNNSYNIQQFGLSDDQMALADYDGDGKTDIAVYRPSTGTWYWLNSSNNSFSAVKFGIAGDVPVPADYDGDGKADLVVFRPSTGVWYRVNSSNNQFSAVTFGLSEDKPIVGDFDGDGKSDIAVWRPSSGVWYRLNSSDNSFGALAFGLSGDKPTAADFDGDGKTDIAVFRPSTGVWYHLKSSDGSFSAVTFGLSGDKPTPADYDGDGKTDIAIFRPSSGEWYQRRSTQGFAAQAFGSNGDLPTPNAFVR